MTVKIRDVYILTERGDSLLCKAGVAFVNKDNSIHVILDALPVTGKLLICEGVARGGSKHKGEKLYETHSN